MEDVCQFLFKKRLLEHFTLMFINRFDSFQENKSIQKKIFKNV